MASPSAKSVTIQTVYSDYASDPSISACQILHISLFRWHTPMMDLLARQAP